MNEFLMPMKNWMDEKNITLRMQAHGGFGDYLDAYAVADIPESESLFAGGDYDFLKLLIILRSTLKKDCWQD